MPEMDPPPTGTHAAPTGTLRPRTGTRPHKRATRLPSSPVRPTSRRTDVSKICCGLPKRATRLPLHAMKPQAVEVRRVPGRLHAGSNPHSTARWRNPTASRTEVTGSRSAKSCTRYGKSVDGPSTTESRLPRIAMRLTRIGVKPPGTARRQRPIVIRPLSTGCRVFRTPERAPPLRQPRILRLAIRWYRDEPAARAAIGTPDGHEQLLSAVAPDRSPETTPTPAGEPTLLGSPRPSAACGGRRGHTAQCPRSLRCRLRTADPPVGDVHGPRSPPA